MNIHEYIEKRAGKGMSLGKRYSNMVSRLVDKIGSDDLTHIRNIPALAVETFLQPVTVGKELPSIHRGYHHNVKRLRNNINEARKILKSPDPALSSDDIGYIKNVLEQDIQDLNNSKKAYRNVVAGTTLGYGALGYGGYKGGQKVNKYLQDKKRGK